MSLTQIVQVSSESIYQILINEFLNDFLPFEEKISNFGGLLGELKLGKYKNTVIYH